MARLSIPDGPGALTREWLTQALHQTGSISDVAVKAFDTEMIGEGMGLMGQLARLKLHYDGSESGAPQSLIAKFPSATEENREVGRELRFFEREARFYEEIANEVELRTPRCYYGAMDVERDEYVLLLEDLTPARVGDQVVGCSGDEAELAIRELAKFHATWWESPRLGEIDWMPYASDEVNKSSEESYQKAWEPFLERFGDRLSKAVLETAEELGSNIGNLLDQLAQPPRTIMHGDYRADNLFFATPEGGTPLAVIDWQISSRGRGVYDVAYLMSQSVRVEERRPREMDLLRSYHRTLTENGVRGYEFDQCLRDYRLATLFCLVYPVITNGRLDLGNERGVAVGTAMLERSVAAIVDLNASELLPT